MVQLLAERPNKGYWLLGKLKRIMKIDASFAIKIHIAGSADTCSLSIHEDTDVMSDGLF